MALIGTMKYLTIGDQTYEIAITETDPVFSASAAAGITATDISNWNAKVSDDKTWNGVTLDKSQSSGAAAGYVPYVTSTSATSAKYYPISSSSTYTANAIPKYTSSGYLYAYTPSANDNSTKVATTAYVDAAIPDTSSFSTTDEKLSTTSLGTSTSQYYPIFGEANSTASTKKYSSDFRIKHSNSIFELQIGQVSSNPTRGTIKLVSNQAQGYITLQTGATDSRTITFPDKTGTVALTSDIPEVYSSTNTGGYLTMATLPIYDGTVI